MKNKYLDILSYVSENQVVFLFFLSWTNAVQNKNLLGILFHHFFWSTFASEKIQFHMAKNFGAVI